MRRLSFLFKYFPVAPKIVVYDFACALPDYWLNRQPAHFQNTTFVVDRFHWYNHVSCARSYNLSLYLDCKVVNSQIAEQCNSALNRIKRSVGQMKQVTFMFSVRLFLEMWNQRKIAKLIVALERVRVRVRCRTRCAHRRTGFLPGAAEKAKKC